MLMQAYRHAHLKANGRKGRLSQEGLLHLMGQVDAQYLERYNHSTVARWESGATRPTKDRLEVFGRALDLSTAEVQGLIWLAGIEEEMEAAPNFEKTNQHNTNEDASSSVDLPPGGAIGEERGTYAATSSGICLPSLHYRPCCWLSGVHSGAHGWNAGWIMALYVILAVVLVLVQSFLKLRRSHKVRELYFISVFFLISGNLLQAPAIRMDPYGFYAIGDFANTPMPYLLSTMVNLLLALAAGLIFDFLWKWQYQSGNGFETVYQRAAWTAFPPLIVVYVFALLFCCLGTWIYLLLVFSILGGVIMVILAMQDGEVKINIWEKRLLLQGGVGAILLLTGGWQRNYAYPLPAPQPNGNPGPHTSPFLGD